MKWDITIGPTTICIQNEADPVEAATLAVEFLVRTVGKFTVGETIRVTSNNKSYNLEAILVLSNAGLHAHAKRLKECLEAHRKGLKQ